MTQQILITMAGAGQRFRRAGYDAPKWRIEAKGRSLFAWSMLSLQAFIDAGAPFVFVVRRDEDAASFVRRACCDLGIRCAGIRQLDNMTNGQASTAFAGLDALPDQEAPVSVYNIDTHIRPSALTPGMCTGDGWIPCVRASGTKWSFVQLDDAGRICEVREKERISDLATVGFYGFASARLYRDVYTEHFANGAGVERGERFIAPMYNTLIRRGGAVNLAEVPTDAFVPLGTPEDVAALASEDPE